ncbi:PREDICTED: immune-associated nucleotide-binding protein 13-like [Amphimedon queenslandica]|uniref:AIG1-type G domain-containing protein n=1 Tax=Amphimedon queenslandica TaxID=400682 RepID=A0AAN0JGQ9_AMPQE|nr:PREDICTED: immune-associated nucleotide-binding protein 13-like [Amphimedon queenslandica]|eukprot:XP_019855828.1 PREDICTED: immune-associated nucleotide-binding protein 13-like [Amphimedon queenslandica]
MAAKSELVFSKLESRIKAFWGRDDYNKELRLLVTGKTGEGKSTLVNGILGKHVAKEGAGTERCTTQVAEYKADIEGVPVTVFDSPGLQDATENEDLYLKDMRKKCQNLSLVLYCTKMTNNRLKEEDRRAIVKITHAFGQNFWKYAVLVLTFANTENIGRRDERDEDTGPEPPYSDKESWKILKKKRFEGRVKLWKDSFHKFLIEDVGVRENIVERILVVPVGDSRPSCDNEDPYRLPDRDDWFTDFWMACSLRAREMNLFFKISESRLIKPTSSQATPDKSTDAQNNFVKGVVAILTESYTSEELLEAFSIEETPVQDSTLQLSDAPKVDETYSEKLQENIKKMDREAWVKEKEEINKEDKEKNEREAEANRRESERVQQLQTDITKRKIALDQQRARMLAKEAALRAHPTVVLPPPRRPRSPSWCFLL